MAFVRRRTTAAGTLVTTLMESYRDPEGRPRQRTLANLHGAESADQAYARLSAVAQRLEAQLAPVAKEAEGLPRKLDAKAKHAAGALSATEQIETAALYNRSRWLLSRRRQLEQALAAVERDREVLQPHCSWDAGQLRRAVEEEGRALEAATRSAVGERLAAQQAQRRKVKSDARLRQLGAGALIQEHELLDLAKTLGLIPDSDYPTE